MPTTTIGNLTLAPEGLLADIYDAATGGMPGPVLAGYEGEGPDARYYARPLTARPRGLARTEDEPWA